MAYLHEIVDLGASLDSGFANRRTIDGRVRADLHIVLDDNGAGLGNLLMRAVRPADEAVAVASDDGAVLNDDPIADDDALANRHVRVNDAVIADDGAVSDADVRINHRAIADARAATDRRKRTDRTCCPSTASGATALSESMPGAGCR